MGDCCGGWWWSKWGDICQIGKNFIYKMNKFWESNVKNSDCGQQHYYIYLKVATKVDLKCSQHSHNNIQYDN